MVSTLFVWLERTLAQPRARHDARMSQVCDVMGNGFVGDAVVSRVVVLQSPVQ
jgi:hypothetical protein